MMAPTEQGFTGHRQMDALGVVHMKGRIYDPTIGRFLQADPFIQAPKNSQNYNRYSYVLNNPMSYTDPSGYFFKAVFNFIKKNWRTIVSIVASYVTFGLTTTAWNFAEIANLGTGMLIGGGSASGFVGGLVSTGSLRGALQGALSGALFGAIGGAGLEGWSAFSVSGIAGGMLSELQGGQFGHGFISAGIGAVSGGLFGKAPINRVVGSAIIGGTISELTGGKFANGAMTAAFAAALRADWSESATPRTSEQPKEELTSEQIETARKNFYAARDKVMAGAKSGEITKILGLADNEIHGGYDAIEWEFVDSLPGKSVAENITEFSEEGITKIKITVSAHGALTMDDAFITIGHELRHSSWDNYYLPEAVYREDGSYDYLKSPINNKEYDAERVGRAILRKYGGK